MRDMQDGLTEGNAPSPTALRVAVLRALHQTVDIPPVLVDPLAERMLGPKGKVLLETYRARADETRHLRATLAARGVATAKLIADAVEQNVRQCVILGAGLDTFAYRHAYANLRVYEVDHPKTQAWKRDALRHAEIDPPANLAYAGADFERDDVLAALAAAGFDLSQPTVFVMLGVSFYLTRQTLLELLGRIGAECAGGTSIVFDYSESLDRAPEAARARYQAAAKRVAAAGEPWISFFSPTEIAEALRASGFADSLDLDQRSQNACWFAARTDGLAVAPLAHIVIAWKRDSAVPVVR